MRNQNTSHAIMSQRDLAENSLDFFPTPPWATRALCERLLSFGALREDTVWEPACGAGHMVKPIKEYFFSVFASDIKPAKAFEELDFLSNGFTKNVDWIIANPPFSFAEKFALKANSFASKGVALLVRTQFLETVGRYNRLFNVCKPYCTLQFVERVPMHKGRLLKNGSTATSYCWIVWLTKSRVEQTTLTWIEPCRKRLEKDSDYAS